MHGPLLRPDWPIVFFVFFLIKLIMFWKRFLAKRWVGKVHFFLGVFFLKKVIFVPEKVFSSQRSRSSAGRLGEGWTPTLLANLARAHGSI